MPPNAPAPLVVTREIGGVKYTMEVVGALTGRQIVLRLAGPATKAFHAAMASGSKLPSGADAAAEAMASRVLLGIGAMLDALPPADFEFVCNELAARTTVTRKESPGVAVPLSDVFDDHFKARYDDMLVWLRWGVEANRFFGSVLASLSAATQAQSRSTSPPASTGGSGASSPAPA